VKRRVWIGCLAAYALLLGVVVAGQVGQAVQEKKSTATQASTQSHLAYQKMECSEALTQQMAQNQHQYKKKVQSKASSRKMTQSGGGNGNGNSGGQGQQGSRNGNGGGNG